MTSSVTKKKIVQFDDVWPDINKVPGWLSPGQEKCLFELVNKISEDARILELGCYLGRSTTAMAFACKGTERQIFCIDSFCGNDSDFINGEHEISWEGDDFVGVFEGNIAQNNLFAHVNHLKGITTDIAPYWVRSLDMLFVDAGHTYDAVLADFKAYFPFVNSGGIVALHDVTEGWPDVKRVWDEEVAPLLKDTGNVGSLAFGTKI